MTIATSTLSKVYQVTVPSSVRQELGLEPGDKVDFELVNGEIIIKKALTLDEQVDDLIAELDRINAEADRRLTPEQKRLNEMTRGWTVNQFHEYFDNTPEHMAYIKEKYGV